MSIKRVLNKETLAAHKAAVKFQEDIHREKGTHPGKGWGWYSNISHIKDIPIDKTLEAIKISSGAKKVKSIDAAYGHDKKLMKPPCNCDAVYVSIWVKR